jgi:hypothetical protein
MHEAVRLIVGARGDYRRRSHPIDEAYTWLEAARVKGLVTVHVASIGEVDQHESWTLAPVSPERHATLARLADGILIHAGHRTLASDLEWLVDAGLAEWVDVVVTYRDAGNPVRSSRTCAQITKMGSDVLDSGGTVPRFEFRRGETV